MQRMIRVVLPVLFLGTAALFLAGCSESGASAADMQKRQQAIAQSDHHIVPGQRIGPIRLGMGMDEVLAELGQPDKIWTHRSGDTDWNYWSLNLVVGFDNSSAPTVLWIEDRTWTGVPVHVVFRTAEGIGVGSSSFDVKRAYGSPDEGPARVMQYTSRKTEFWIEDYKVFDVQVGQLGQ
jgi:hypothetical protein